MKVTLVETQEELDQFYRVIREFDVLSLDLETEGLSWYFHNIKLVSIGTKDDVFIFLFDKYASTVHNTIKHKQFVMHNKLFDATWLRSLGLIFDNPPICTQTQAFLIDPTQALALSQLANFIDMHSVERAFHDYMRNNLLHWGTVNEDSLEYLTYAGVDAYATWHLWDREDRPYSLSLFDIEMRSQEAISHMMVKGVRVDTELAHSITIKYEQYIQELLDYTQHEYGINLRKKNTVAKRMINDGWDPVYTDKGNVSLSEDALFECSHPLSKIYTKYQEYNLILTRYLKGKKGPIKLVRDTGRVYPNMRVCNTVTGRMTCDTPSLHQIPRKNHIRNIFIPSEGYVFVCADFQRAELAQYARYAQDPNMIAALSKKDMHTYIAKQVWPEKVITEDVRHDGKTVTFSILYGVTPEGIAKKNHKSIREATRILTDYHKAFPLIKQYTFDLIKHAPEIKNGLYREIVTVDGRIEHIPVDRLKTTILNYLIQGSTSDMLKKAIVRIWDSDIGQFLRVPIHDELILECPKKDAEEVKNMVNKLMRDDEGYPSIGVDAEIMPRWRMK